MILYLYYTDQEIYDILKSFDLNLSTEEMDYVYLLCTSISFNFIFMRNAEYNIDSFHDMHNNNRIHSINVDLLSDIIDLFLAKITLTSKIM